MTPPSERDLRAVAPGGSPPAGKRPRRSPVALRSALPPSRLALLLVGLAVSACAHPGRRPEPSEIGGATPSREEGLASYYARSLDGRMTASGARYDARAMTAAHRSHAFGTQLRVTDLETGKSVVVTVTDRGPYAKGRVIDLSRAAALALGILERGLVRVLVEVVRPPG